LESAFLEGALSVFLESAFFAGASDLVDADFFAFSTGAGTGATSAGAVSVFGDFFGAILSVLYSNNYL